MEATFAILWHRPATSDEHWYIRGVKPDETFYGEIRSSGAIANIEGQIPGPTEAGQERCRILLTQLACGPPIAPCNRWVARIGRWRTSLADAEIVAGYEPGDEQRSNAGKKFLELLLILENQISRRSNSVE